MELQKPDVYKRRGQIRNWYNHDEAINGDFLSLKELDINLTPIDQKIVDLLGSGKEVLVEKIGPRHAVQVPLAGHEIVILKRI